ncbi:LOW QUALITY PROTEIN: angiomotin-like protein 2 [Manduca sexta]|uniref:LOW QUALITY PROTEIN: angiomotin-like protein 2 n=1 Tax=Manduca sexta TaxID=7130 RepID=UPI00188F120A|nr:LOW QUALITY PROTEIN: angiomotin-like protein 2 [Manduca sexta]
MGSMRPTGRFLSFANNIQRTQKQAVPTGFPQSLSGSETDVSTSNENLSREERYVVRHTTRVEPQGQENQSQSNNNNNRNSLKESVTGSNRNSLKDSVGGSNSNRSSLDVSSSSYNTLIIHSQDDSWSTRPTPIREHERSSSEVKHTNTQSSPYHTLKKTEGVKKPSGIPLPKVHKEQVVTTTANYIDIGGQRIYTSPPDHGVQEITEIPDDFLNQSSVLKHLAKEVAQSPTPRGPTPPASPRAPPPRDEGRKPKGKGSKSKLSKEKLSLSRSQPDLTSVGVRAVPGGSESSGWCSGGEGSLEDTVYLFRDPLEEEVEKVRTAHEELVSSCERRERLERAARARLQADCRRLQELNRALKQQVDLLSQGVRTENDNSAEALRKELQNREMLIAQLITQNKELACAKERQEIEMSAQRATLQEQRTHIDILDTALTNAQANVVRLEEECRHAGGYVERVAGLQRALGSLQLAAERREHSERKLRHQLETELHALSVVRCVVSHAGGYVERVAGLQRALGSLQLAAERREHSELSHAGGYVERVAGLQRALGSLQLAAERREHSERKLRHQLETELHALSVARGRVRGARWGRCSSPPSAASTPSASCDTSSRPSCTRSGTPRQCSSVVRCVVSHAGGYVERVAGLQRALGSLQLAAERREHSELSHAGGYVERVAGLQRALRSRCSSPPSAASTPSASCDTSSRPSCTRSGTPRQCSSVVRCVVSHAGGYVERVAGLQRALGSLQLAAERREHSELSHAGGYVERVAGLQRALGSLQLAAERREHSELSHAGGYVERVAGLQRALGSLQLAAERREHSERKLRHQLETELHALRYTSCRTRAGTWSAWRGCSARWGRCSSPPSAASTPSASCDTSSRPSCTRSGTPRQCSSVVRCVVSHAGGYVERVAGLQRALGSLQLAAERREHSERKLRHQLETELHALRKRECNCGGANSLNGNGETEAELRRQLRERDERFLALEGECAKWEQRYLEEAALRQAAVSAASIPKDAKIAALEKTSAESERLMAEARNEKIRHMDELHSAQKKVADLEGRKRLESKVAERDAMIKVLQKHTSAAYDSGASLRNNSSREELVGLSSGASFSSAEGGGSVAGRYRHLTRRNYSPHNDNSSGCGFESGSLGWRRLEEQLAALESRLERAPCPP